MEIDQSLTVNLAIGRIFRIMSRPYKDGDKEEYERCRKIILDLEPDQGDSLAHLPEHNYGRDSHSALMRGD